MERCIKKICRKSSHDNPYQNTRPKNITVLLIFIYYFLNQMSCFSFFNVSSELIVLPSVIYQCASSMLKLDTAFKIDFLKTELNY